MSRGESLARGLARCLIVSLASLLCVGRAWPQEACVTCEKQLTLNAAEWACLAQSIDRYLAVKSDPVLVPFVQCEQRPTTPSEQVRSDPIITPTQKSDGVATYRRALRLSKLQLRCLKTKLPDLVAQKPPSFDLEKNCPPTAGAPAAAK